MLTFLKVSLEKYIQVLSSSKPHKNRLKIDGNRVSSCVCINKHALAFIMQLKLKISQEHAVVFDRKAHTHILQI